MIWFLRHIGIHLWIITLFAIPVSFLVLPLFAKLFPGISPVLLSFCIVVGMGALLGSLMDTAARKKVIQLIKEGQAWERSGIIKKAKKKYIKALRIYDTFLLWPFSARKTALKISSAIAGFELNNQSHNENFKMGTAVYLKMNPKDADLAHLWLGRISRTSVVSSFEQDVLSLLAREYMRNPGLSLMIANIFLGLRRNDLLAKKIYQQAMKNPQVADQYADRIEEVVDAPPDPFVQPASYEDSYAATHMTSFTGPEGRSEKKSQKQMDAGMHLFGVLSKLSALFQFLWSLIRQAGLGIWQVICLTYTAVFSGIRKTVRCFKNDERFRRYLKVGALFVVGAGFLFFMVSTLSHTFKTRAPKKEDNTQQAVIPKPFTIQVAAYLKQSHAQRYVDTLKKKQIDATMKKVTGGGKTWFVVRVSKFTDKKSAADYGNQLKQQHIIDDFFVNNR